MKGINPYIVSEADAGKTIQLKKGELMDVSLEGNLTTGFTWEVLVQDPVLVEQVGEPEYKADSEKLGSSGNITLHFFSYREIIKQLTISDLDDRQSSKITSYSLYAFFSSDSVFATAALTAGKCFNKSIILMPVNASITAGT